MGMHAALADQSENTTQTVKRDWFQNKMFPISTLVYMLLLSFVNVFLFVCMEI